MKREVWTILYLNPLDNTLQLGKACSSEECALSSVHPNEGGIMFGPVKMEFDDEEKWQYDDKKCQNQYFFARLIQNEFNPIVVPREPKE